MFTPNTSGDLWNSLSPATIDPGLAALSGQQADLSGALGAPFELALTQVLTRLLDRLENEDTPAAAASNAPSGRASPKPTWIYPTPPAAPPVVKEPAVKKPAAEAPAAERVPATVNSAAPLSGAPAAKQAYETAAQAAAPVAAPAAAAPAAKNPSRPMALADFPHPPGDNGRGMHWVPTTGTQPEAVDRFVAAMQEMHIKWVTLLNDGANVGANDYLVRKIKAAGMEPVMRIYTPGLQPISGDLGAAVRHYKSLGVSYFQLYNEPNHSIENDGRQPDVNRYLDVWIPAAKAVIDNGGLPGFGALSPGGEFKDSEFLKQALDGLRARGETALLDRAWLSIHNYQGDLPQADPQGFSRFKVYADILNNKLGRLLPMIGTEGGSFAAGPHDEERRISLVTNAYRYMANREPYNFAYTYWIVANEAGGGSDPAWEGQALFREDGHSPLVDALKAMQ